MKEQNQTNTKSEIPALRRLGRSALAAFPANKAMIGALALLLGSGLAALADDNRAPEVPGDLAVGSTNKVSFHGFGVGVQIYTWDGTSWGAPVPDAILFDGNGVVVDHSAGPTWESNSGSKVVGALPPKAAVIVDTNAIPWLLLAAKTTEGPGIFADTSVIQRVNTVGGKAPKTDGTFIGQVARVPYTADYFFYRRTDS